MAHLSLRGIYKRYAEDVLAVKDFNLEIQDGEFIVLVGPSGCGKSTTLRMIAGLEEISQGELRIDDRVVNDVAPKDRDLAMVFQSYALYPHMTVFENMAFGLRLRKFPKKEIDTLVRDAAQILGISEFLERRPKALSGGQRQRVAMGRAIVRKPKVFLFDEPLSNLDAKLRVQMRSEIAKLHRRLQTTSIYVTHDQTEAMTLADRIVVMKDGLIFQVGAPLELYRKPANRFVGGFIGSPAMNFFKGKVHGEKIVGENVEIPIGKTAQAKVSEGQEVWLGIRPESVCTEGGVGQLKGIVEVRELMGAELFAYLNVAGVQCVGRFKAESPLREGHEVSLSLDPSSCHLFDATTELTICNGLDV